MKEKYNYVEEDETKKTPFQKWKKKIKDKIMIKIHTFIFYYQKYGMIFILPIYFYLFWKLTSFMYITHCQLLDTDILMEIKTRKKYKVFLIVYNYIYMKNYYLNLHIDFIRNTKIFNYIYDYLFEYFERSLTQCFYSLVYYYGKAAIEIKITYLFYYTRYSSDLSFALNYESYDTTIITKILSFPVVVSFISIVHFIKVAWLTFTFYLFWGFILLMRFVLWILPVPQIEDIFNNYFQKNWITQEKNYWNGYNFKDFFEDVIITLFSENFNYYNTKWNNFKFFWKNFYPTSNYYQFYIKNFSIIFSSFLSLSLFTFLYGIIAEVYIEYRFFYLPIYYRFNIKNTVFYSKNRNYVEEFTWEEHVNTFINYVLLPVQRGLGPDLFKNLKKMRRFVFNIIKYFLYRKTNKIFFFLGIFFLNSLKFLNKKITKKWYFLMDPVQSLHDFADFKNVLEEYDIGINHMRLRPKNKSVARYFVLFQTVLALFKLGAFYSSVRISIFLVWFLEYFIYLTLSHYLTAVKTLTEFFPAFASFITIKYKIERDWANQPKYFNVATYLNIEDVLYFFLLCISFNFSLFHETENYVLFFNTLFSLWYTRFILVAFGRKYLLFKLLILCTSTFRLLIHNSFFIFTDFIGSLITNRPRSLNSPIIRFMGYDIYKFHFDVMYLPKLKKMINHDSETIEISKEETRILMTTKFLKLVPNENSFSSMPSEKFDKEIFLEENSIKNSQESEHPFIIELFSMINNNETWILNNNDNFFNFNLILSIIFCIFSFIIILIPLLISVAYLTLLERKIIGHMQRRTGPVTVGFLGLLQPLADGFKLFLKETIIPSHSERFIYILAPIITFSLSLLNWIVIPFDYNNSIFNINLSALFIFAISSLSVYGVILAGWSSNSKYAFLGAIRSSAQMISYEISISLILLSVFITSYSLNFIDIINSQKFLWNCTFHFPIFFLFLVSILAETNRHPFDLPEAEAELVSGYNVEYSSMTFALFFLGEYANIILMSLLTSIFFLGGWHFPFFYFPSFIFLIIKMLLVIFFFIWCRAAFPRYRYDQLMFLGWKILLPFSISWIIFTLGSFFLFDSLYIYNK
jgi:NADH-quinone oxidoreductase subunit H